MTDNSCYIVLGEAPESDDEDFPQKNDGMQSVHLGRGSNASEEMEELDISSGTFIQKGVELKDNLAEEAKYNTLLHRKLRESNFKLKVDMSNFVKSCLGHAGEQVNEINQSLLTAQIESQESINLKNKGILATAKINLALISLLSHKLV